MSVTKTEQIIQAGQRYVMNTYNRMPLVVARGEGSRIWDVEGKEYLDFVGGLAVTALGHGHPAILEAIVTQSKELLHCSNLYWNQPQVELAKLLVENSVFNKVFFANSGAEANEGAIKLARKFAALKSPEKHEIITMNNSFHGRTLATLTATGQAKFHHHFQPLPQGFKYSPYNDLEQLAKEIDHKTCAIMLEPIQGEGGVHVAEETFIQGVRQLCDRNDLLLIFDEVQVGIGRTGKMFAYEHYGVTPDIITLAKALGGGVPIGALMATEEVAAAFQPGDHATTFGGNPLVCSVGVAVLNAILQENVLVNAKEMGELALAFFNKIKENNPVIKEVRGKGLIIGIELVEGAPEVADKCEKAGLLVNCAAGKVIRILPPLNIEQSDLEQGLKIIENAINQIMI